MPRLAANPDNVVTVDLAAVAANYRALRALLPAGTRVAGVVKADAYGHGLLRVGRRLVAEGAEALAVATVTEAILLRRHGLEVPIYLLLGLWPEDAAQAAAHQLTPVCGELEPLKALSAAAREQGVSAACQIKVDTGMGRLGALPGQALELLEAAAALPALTVTGLVSHLATSGDPDSVYAEKQAALFADLLAQARARGHALPDSSLVGSGGCLAPPAGSPGPPGLARLGISLYGGLPDPASAGRAPLAGAMSFATRLLAARRVPAGTGVSYGVTYTTPTATWLGVVPMGYSDGYPRSASNRAQALVEGRRVPLRGRVCMNLSVLDLGEGPPPPVGSEVVLLGCQAEQEITADQLGAWADTISYEITCSLGAANRRRWLD